MKPVDQTIIDPNEGNCLMACIASVLECRLEDVPYIPPKGGRQLADTRRWLETIGWTLIVIDVSGPKKHYTAARIPIGTVMLVSGASKTFKDGKHVVVGQISSEIGEWEMIHDPNPSRNGIGEVYYYYFFVPLNPAEYLLIK